VERKEHTYEDGSRYEGEWQDEKRQGQGVWTRPDGTVYAGEWKNDKPDGQGTLTRPDGLKYTGGWREGKRSGHGIWSHPGGASYSGDWLEGKKHGQGTNISSDGKKYVGSFNAGHRDGIGSIVYADGTSYEGEWRNNKRDGQGKSTFHDGTRYSGGWRDDKPAGRGVFTYADGTTKTGSWQDGKFIEDEAVVADQPDRLEKLEQDTLELKKELSDVGKGGQHQIPAWKKWWVWALVILMAFVLISILGGEDEPVVIPEAPEEEISVPQPQPDLESLWNSFTDWASEAWNSIQSFFTGLLENLGGTQDSPPLEPLTEQVPEETELPPDS
jgi:hypothetical protein